MVRKIHGGERFEKANDILMIQLLKSLSPVYFSVFFLCMWLFTNRLAVWTDSFLLDGCVDRP